MPQRARKQAQTTLWLQGPGRPRLVSMLLYLNSSWPLSHGAETLFLDGATDTGIAVQPKPGRMVLMDQDITHRVSAPTKVAGRPRYSLVWKLALLPKAPRASRGGVASIQPTVAQTGAAPFGSAVQMQAAQDQAVQRGT